MGIVAVVAAIAIALLLLMPLVAAAAFWIVGINMSEALHWTTVGILAIVFLLQLIPAWARFRDIIIHSPKPTDDELDHYELDRFDRLSESFLTRIVWSKVGLEHGELSTFVKWMDRRLLPDNFPMTRIIVRVVSVALLGGIAIARFAAGEPILNLFAR